MSKERRKDFRLRLDILVRVRGYDPDGTPWEEKTSTSEASLSGLSFALEHSVAVGDALELSLPLPSQFRQYDYEAPNYHVHAVIRKIAEGKPPHVGVIFFGKEPPGDRDYVRQKAELPVRVRGHRKRVAWEEATTTLDVSAAGASLLLAHPVEVGDAVHLALPLPPRFRHYDVKAPTYQVHALVRKVGRGNPCRVGVQFLGKDPPADTAKVPAADRRHRREDADLPVVVRGHDRRGQAWQENTKTENVSAGGVSFLLRSPVREGDAVHLSLPLPEPYRKFDHRAPSYEVYALVRKVGRGQPRRVGAMFFGKDPPMGSDFCVIPSAPGMKERRHPRYEMFLNVKLRRLEADPRQEELSVIENISEGGAQNPTTLPIAKNEIVHVEEIGGTFRARAQVQSVHVGKDKVPRLHLKFVDPEASKQVQAILRKAGILGLSRG